MLRPLHIEAIPGYKLRLQFADGVAGEIDLSHLVGKSVFSLWSDPAVFAQVSIGAGGEIHWSDQVELSADAVYLQLTGKGPRNLFCETTRNAIEETLQSPFSDEELARRAAEPGGRPLAEILTELEGK